MCNPFQLSSIMTRVYEHTASHTRLAENGLEDWQTKNYTNSYGKHE